MEVVRGTVPLWVKTSLKMLTKINQENNAKIELPDAKTMAGNLLDSTKKVFEHLAATGQILLSEEKANERLNVCKSCDLFITETSRCSKCGCGMLIKTRLEAMSCPVGKW